MEETLVLKRNKNQNKVMRSLYFKIYSLGKEKKRYFHYSHKSTRKKVFLILSNILKAGYLATLLMKLVFVTLILSIAPLLDACKTKYLARKGVL